MTVRAMITRHLSREGVPTSRAGLLPLLKVERGFQAVGRSGPGYDEERVRPVLALIAFGRPCLFLVRGAWRSGRYGQYYVPRGNALLRPEKVSDVVYVGVGNGPYDEDMPDWNEAVARAVPHRAESQPKDAYDFLMEANGRINSAYYDFLGRASNDEMFRSDDLKLAAAAAAMFDQEPSELTRTIRDIAAGGQTVRLINRMIAHLEYLRDVYAADRETIKAWRSERLEAYDALQLSANLAPGHEGHQASPEYKRWQAIQDVGPLEYPLNSQERSRRDEEREERARLTPLAPQAVTASARGEQR
jgi:hypothetical protein